MKWRCIRLFLHSEPLSITLLRLSLPVQTASAVATALGFSFGCQASEARDLLWPSSARFSAFLNPALSQKNMTQRCKSSRVIKRYCSIRNLKREAILIWQSIPVILFFSFISCHKCFSSCIIKMAISNPTSKLITQTPAPSVKCGNSLSLRS